MARYLIEDVKLGACEVGMACGPIDAPVAAEIKVKTDKNECFYLSLAEVMGFPNFYRTPDSIFDIHMHFADVDEDVFNKINEYYLEVQEYDDVFENPETEDYDLYRLLIDLVGSDKDEMEEAQKKYIGKYLDEINIPVSYIEQEYLDAVEYEA